MVAVNDVTDAATLAHLLEYDSTYGRLGLPVTSGDGRLLACDTPIAVLSQRDPAQIDWAALGADIVIESTGKFRTEGILPARHPERRRAQGADLGARQGRRPDRGTRRQHR